MATQPEDIKTRPLLQSHYAYLRVSTDKQDVDNQKHGLLEYANSVGLANVIMVEDSASGRIDWHDRKLGELLTQTAQPGDIVLFSEVSRMGRSTLQVLEILKHCVDRNITVHIAKQKMIMDGSIQAQITATVLGLAAYIEREFIAMRTKESLAQRKAQLEKTGSFVSKAGKTITNMGRPKGPAAHTKLDDQEKQIREWINMGLSKRAVCKLAKCAPSTLYDFIDRKKITKAVA